MAAAPVQVPAPVSVAVSVVVRGRAVLLVLVSGGIAVRGRAVRVRVRAEAAVSAVTALRAAVSSRQVWAMVPHAAVAEVAAALQARSVVRAASPRRRARTVWQSVRNSRR